MIHAGHQIIWANDNDSDAYKTYKNNIGKHIVLSDIELVDSKDIPNAEVLIGGFPCQGFSQANLLRFIKDERNKLYLEFLRVLKDKQPKYFLAENVRGILSLGGGKVIQTIEKHFKAAGYRVWKQLFNVADYGVPQKRWRVIIAGTRIDLPRQANFTFPLPTHAETTLDANGDLKPWISVSEALRDIPEPSTMNGSLIPNHAYSKYKVTNRNFTGHRKTNPNKPSPTILARGNGKGGVCAIQHPRNHRRMSIRESAMIQTFPDDFVFSGKLNSCYRQVGNAVPVLFAFKLGLELNRAECTLLRSVQ